MRAITLVPLLLLCAACKPAPPSDNSELAALKAEIAELRARPAAEPAPPELGQQMLELQIRHARLWQAGEAGNWMLTQFQLAELRESIKGVIELNGDHAALQPERLAEVMPAMLDPSLKQLQQAVDAQDRSKFDAGYDALSKGCTACHEASGHGFLVIQRPRTPVLDNLRASPLP